VFLHLGGGRGDGHVPGGRGKSASSVLESTGTISRFRGGWHSPPSFESRFAVVRALASGHSPTRIAFASRRGASSSPLVFLVLLRYVALLIAGQLSCLIAATISYTYTNSSVSLVFPSVFRLRRSHLSSLRSLSTVLRSSPWQRHRLDILVLNAAHLPEQPEQLPGCSDAGLSVVRPSIANGSEPCDALTGSCLRLASCSARVFLNGTHRRRRLPCARITGKRRWIISMQQPLWGSV